MVLLLPDTLTVEEATATLRLLGQRMNEHPGELLVIDAAHLRHFDSSALAVLLGCERQAAACGKRIEVRHLPSRLSALAEVYGVAGLLPVAG